MAYTVDLAPAAQRDLKKFDPPVQKQLTDRIEDLQDDPRPVGCKTLKGEKKKFYRIRDGDYRIIYEINDSSQVATVLTVRHRKNAY